MGWNLKADWILASKVGGSVVLGELGPRVLHTVGAPSGSHAEGLGLHPVSEILGRSWVTVALPPGVGTRIK